MVAIEKHLFGCDYCHKETWHARMTFLKESECSKCGVNYKVVTDHLICEGCGVDTLSWKSGENRK